ncbi:hypothetical protein Barb4_03278 [Bacteroidales bacterium Barb4]|nr:hypothetical protein Barb4_03278 [Bacteroidales bacterium Barb4]
MISNGSSRNLENLVFRLAEVLATLKPLILYSITCISCKLKIIKQ